MYTTLCLVTIAVCMRCYLDDGSRGMLFAAFVAALVLIAWAGVET